jgi:hypothetical protein
MNIKKSANIGVALIFALFYGYLLLQFSKVFVYYDDFGYLSLSYGYNVKEVVGSDYSLSQAVRYIGHHYYDTNGRLLCMFLYLLLYLAGGLKLVQVFTATSVLAVAGLSYALAMRGLRQKGRISGAAAVMTAAFICLLYGFIGILVLRMGVYWFAASFLYVAPAVTVICFGWMYYGTVRKERGKGYWAGCAALAFLGAFTQEQWLVAVIAMVLTVCACRYYLSRTEGRSGKPGPGDLTVMAGALLGAFPILTSPAVRERMERHSEFMQRSFFQRILYNIKAVTRLFFEPSNQNYIYILLIMVMIMTMLMMVKKRGKMWGHMLFLLASASAGAYVFVQVHVLYHGQASQYQESVVWLMFVYLLWMTGQILYFLLSEGNELQALFTVAGFFSMACLAVVPELPDRVLLPYMLLSFSLMGYVFGTAFGETSKRLISGAVFLLCAAAVSVPNLRNVYRGYRANWEVLQYNDAMIRQGAERIRQGEEIKEIRLYRLLDDLCAQDMVYNPNFSFMIYWMDHYYDLPSDVELVFDTVGSMEDLKIQESR